MKVTIVTLAACLAIGCSNAAKPVAQSENTAVSTKSPEKSQTAIAHSTENQPQPQAVPPASSEKSKWTASGDPIDTTKFDSAVMAAEKTAGGKPSKALGDAYYKRAVALTEARQYASALGDYRRTLKNDPSNADAKEWVDKIIMIYDSLNKTSPKEGEEPPPLPFKKS
ncbi:MAG: hypothetical protein QM785_08340 [Pyrinomonadaceae bacterium]